MMQSLRPRRLRKTAAIRSMVRETSLSVDDLIYPLFIVPGQGVRNEIASLPNIYHLSADEAVKEAQSAYALGIRSVIVFGIPEYKDEIGSSAWDMASPVQQVIMKIKEALPDMIVVADTCMCEYTSHGHCGALCGCDVDNDRTLELLARTAVSQVKAGADMIAPSDMMDGRVAAIRTALDKEGYTDIPIMSYTVKYASAYYGPFRDAADSAPQFGDRRSYQMDPANVREAMKEVELDLAEGADIIMVKPALAYLDVVRAVREAIDRPVAVYNVSGEYAMIKAAAQNGWIEEKRIVLETLLGMKRAGADIIITYHAMDVARWLKEGNA